MSNGETSPCVPVGVFHPGTQHSWQTAGALQELGRLQFNATSLFYQPNRWPYMLERLPVLGGKLEREFRRFAAEGIDPALVRTGGWHEWAERICARLGRTGLTHLLNAAGNKAFVRVIEDDVASDRPFALWGYNQSSLESFALGKRHGRTCILDQTIGDPRALDREMAALQETYGDWFLGGHKRTDSREIERADAEYALADRILVGCDYAASTIAAEATDAAVAGKLEVLEYCYDPAFDAVEPVPHDLSGPVRFLFAGLGIPRKGIHHVLEAISRFPEEEATLTLLGSVDVPPETFAPFAGRVTHIPTLPRSEVPAVMARHDVLLFPTYFEGAGLVLYEALAAGMALIQTDRAARAVTPETGIMLERPETDALTSAMERAVSDRELLVHWRSNARASARNYRFAAYRDRIADLLARMEFG